MGEVSSANTAMLDKLNPEQIEPRYRRKSLFESLAYQDMLRDLDNRRLSHLCQGKEQADDVMKLRQGSSLSRELVAQLGCARFRLEARNDESGLWRLHPAFRGRPSWNLMVFYFEQYD